MANKLHISMSDHGRGEVFVDGAKIDGVLSIAFAAGVGEINTCTLAVSFKEIRIEGPSDIVRVTNIGSESHEYAKVGNGD